MYSILTYVACNRSGRGPAALSDANTENHKYRQHIIVQLYRL